MNIDDKIPLTRRVLFEKVHNNKLIVYTLATAQKEGDNVLHDIYTQYEDGRRLALQLGLTPFLYSDSNCDTDAPLNKGQFQVLNGVIRGEIKFIYVMDFKMICRYNWVRKYILALFALNKVKVYTKSGIYPIQQIKRSDEVEKGAQILIEEISKLALAN